MEEYCGLSDGECLVGVEAGAGATTMTQTNQLKGPTRENPHTFASPYHGTIESIAITHYLQCFLSYNTAMVSRFEARKHKILEQLDAPDEEYHDLSPKGSVDAPIRDLIREINRIDGIVTTSSCSGRISVFLEGRKTDSGPYKAVEEDEGSRAGPGGKGGGGAWLFISHNPVEVPEVASASDLLLGFGLEDATAGTSRNVDVNSRFIHLKFEPMVRRHITMLSESSLTPDRFCISCVPLSTTHRSSSMLGWALASGRAVQSVWDRQKQEKRTQ